MDDLNYLLFSSINASAHAGDVSVAFARFAAQWLVYLALAIVAGLWIWGAPAKRSALLATCIGVVLGLAINRAIGLLWFHPRPFMVNVGRTLMAHAAETSFPSDHVTILWSLAFGLIATASWPRVGGLLVLLGLVVGWARVYLGLHFPFDVAGAFLVALFAAACARYLRGYVERWLLPPTEMVYGLLLHWLRIPSAICPRRDEIA